MTLGTRQPSTIIACSSYVTEGRKLLILWLRVTAHPSPALDMILLCPHRSTESEVAEIMQLQSVNLTILSQPNVKHRLVLPFLAAIITHRV